MRKVFYLGAACILAAGIASCTKDVDGGHTKPLEQDQSFFANIQVCGAETMSRSYDDKPYNPQEDPQFDKGEGYENEVSSIYFIFYDEEGNRVSTTQVRRDNAHVHPDDGSDLKDSQGFYASENAYYSGVVQIDVKHGSLPPAYVMAFVNPITSTNFEINPAFENLTRLQQTTRPRIIGDDNLFAMSKSVYYDPDRPEGEQKVMATILKPGQLFPKREEAQAAVESINGTESNDTVVKIYVERYAVKVNLTVSEKAKAATFDVDGESTLKFVPEYWAVNAYEENTYVVKSFMGSDGKEMSYNTLVTAMDYDGNGEADWRWNSPALHRCFWAQTPAYYANKYPRVADDIYDNGSDYYALGYYSYNQMAENADQTLIAKARSLKAEDKETYSMIYARENTISGQTLHDAYNDPLASPKAAIASVVIVGHYDIDGEEPEMDFYVIGNSTNGYTLFKSDDEMLHYFLKTTIPLANSNHEIIFNRTTGEFTKEDYKQYINHFHVVHPTASAREDVVVDSRFVTIQLDEENIPATNAEAEVYAYIDGQYMPVSKENLNVINKELFYAAGTAQGYNGGKAYFTVPIQHLGFHRGSNTKNAGKSANSKDFEWMEVRTGDFGLVRNHTYTIEITDIKGLGNAIPDPDDPIVPPTDPEEYFIGARLIVLNWAMVPVQREVL